MSNIVNTREGFCHVPRYQGGMSRDRALSSEPWTVANRTVATSSSRNDCHETSTSRVDDGRAWPRNSDTDSFRATAGRRTSSALPTTAASPGSIPTPSPRRWTSSPCWPRRPTHTSKTMQTWGINEGIVGVAQVQEGGVLETDDEHVVVGTAGHVDHGKSTLVGSLVTGKPDDGDGATRAFLDVQPHEVERGLRPISYAVYGFDDDGPVRVRNPNRKADRAEVVQEADRLVSFVDTVGHEPWLRTTIRGLVGQKLDYGLLVVDADDGPTRTTREHLGVLLATDLPTIVAITKTDTVDEERIEEVEREVERLLQEVDKSPLRVARHGIDAAVEEVSERRSHRRNQCDHDGRPRTLDELFDRLPKTSQDTGEFRMYVDRESYSVTGVGAVASGTVMAGEVGPATNSCSARWPTAGSRRSRFARSRCTITGSTRPRRAGSSGSHSRESRRRG